MEAFERENIISKLKVRGLMENLLPKLGDSFFALRDRWEDEKMFEQWGDYGKTMKNLVVKNSNSVLTDFKATKRPFGIKFHYEGYRIHFYIQVKGIYGTFKATAKLIQ